MLRNEVYVGTRIWNRTKFVKTPGTNKRVARPRPRREWQTRNAPELRIINDDLWTRVQARQDRLKEVYADSGRKPVNRGASSAYLLSGFLTCGECGANLIITSGGKGHSARYGCPQHWNRHACPNKITIRQTELEVAFFGQLPAFVLTPDAIEYIVDGVMRAQHKKTSKSDHEKRIQELKNGIARIVAAIAATGHSDALLATLKSNEVELRKLAAATENSKQLTPGQISSSVRDSLREIPKLLSMAPELAKTKLAQHIDKIRMLPQPDGSYVAEGKWDLLAGDGSQALGAWGPVMVAGAGFEPATFGL